MQKLALEYLIHTKDRFPDRTALVEEGASLSYRELWQAAVALGGQIKRAVPGPRRPVVVDIDKSIVAVTALLAVQLSGHIYVPLDPASPAERRKSVWRLLDNPPAVTWDGHSFRLDGKPVAAGDVQSEQETALLEGLRALTGLDPLYIIFTSGTTGEPKGVTIANASVIDYIDWVVKTYAVDEHDIIGSQAPLYFDNSVLDLYASFATGATLHLIGKRRFRFLSDLVAYLEEQRVSLIFFVPSLLANIAAFDLFSGRKLDGLRKVLFAGEAMPLNTLKYLREKLPHALLSNLYGPTEITVDAIFHIFGAELEGLDAVPLGLPCDNSKIVFLDDQGQPVNAPDVVAEICVGGIGVALGYWNNPEKTQAAFIQNPEQSQFREVLYKTGDYGYRSGKDGLIYFVGRRDHQIKHLGHRIELGEIEAALDRIEEVRQCCAAYDRAGQRILAYYTSATAQPIADLRQRLGAFLPAYMVPHACHRLESFPVTANGKIDRERLLAEATAPS
jgi:D-alanine--poly(phosphoribitol) ligase subunit 1